MTRTVSPEYLRYRELAEQAIVSVSGCTPESSSSFLDTLQGAVFTRLVCQAILHRDLTLQKAVIETTLDWAEAGRLPLPEAS